LIAVEMMFVVCRSPKMANGAKELPEKLNEADVTKHFVACV
jgi:hypothetical protein